MGNAVLKLRFPSAHLHNPNAGNGSSIQGGAGLPDELDSSVTSTRLGAWVQDRFRLGSRLTLEGGLRLDWSDVGGGALTSVTSLASSDIDFSFDADWGNADSWAPITYDFISLSDRKRRTVSQEFRLASGDEGRIFGGTTDWLAGIYVLDLADDLAVLADKGLLMKALRIVLENAAHAVAGDGTLFFQSNAYGGFGENDIYKQDLSAGELYASIATFQRVRNILKTLVGQLDILETMTPMSFASFLAERTSSRSTLAMAASPAPV